MIIKLEVTVDGAAFKREAEAHVADDIMPALVGAPYEVAKAAVVGIVGAIDANLDRPSPYTRFAPAMLPARLGGTSDPAALVFLRDDQAEYLDLIVNTGTRRAGARSLAYWIVMIGAIGWLLSQAFDREPPVAILSTEVLTETVRPGEAIRVRYHLLRNRVCRTETSWVILDGISEYRRFGPVVAEAVGRVGDDVFVKGWTLPIGAAPGAGRLRTITTWRCEGNVLHGLYPILRVGPDLHFRIVGSQNP